MNVWRCKCGKRSWYESGMSPRECQGCEACGTSFCKDDEGQHLALVPHDMGEVVQGPATSPRRYLRCKVCYHMEVKR